MLTAEVRRLKNALKYAQKRNKQVRNSDSPEIQRLKNAFKEAQNRAKQVINKETQC